MPAQGHYESKSPTNAIFRSIIVWKIQVQLVFNQNILFQWSQQLYKIQVQLVFNQNILFQRSQQLYHFHSQPSFPSWPLKYVTDKHP
jgi:hypothetical protein